MDLSNEELDELLDLIYYNNTFDISYQDSIESLNVNKNIKEYLLEIFSNVKTFIQIIKKN